MKSSPPDLATFTVGVICGDIVKERARQEQLRLDGKFRATCATVGPDQMTEYECGCVLVEEVGEVARACLGLLEAKEQDDPREYIDHLREELIQVAAVCVAWVERLDTGGPIL